VDKSSVDPLDASVKTPGSEGAVLINSEVEILTSRDLITQVAETVGIERLMPGYKGKDPTEEAVRGIFASLRVSAVKESNIISVSYKNKDPELAVQVLQQLVRLYFEKHLEVHRSTGTFDFVSRQTDQLRTRLNETENQLKQLEDGAGIISSAETEASLNDQLVKSEEELSTTSAEYAAQQARMAEIDQGLSWAQAPQSSADNTTQQVTSEVIQEYQALVARLTPLRQSETDLLARYTPQNRIVKLKHAQIEELDTQRQNMEKKYPGLLETVPAAATSQTARRDLVSEKAQLEALKAKTEALRARVNGIQARVKVFSEIGPKIAELKRTKEVEEESYKYYETSLEKARIDESLDPSRIPNISVVQKPLTAEKSSKDKKMVVLGLAFGGAIAGLAVALLIEMVLDRSVKRPLEFEARLSIPLLLSIPYFGRNGNSRLRLHNEGQESLTSQEDPSLDVDPWESDHFIRPFCEAVRDRLILEFESKRMTYKPKLVAVTGISEGAGASTLAAGLAATLSELCKGRVLLVDEPFDPKRFFELIAEFKAGDFDYVIFDMPTLSNTSATIAMAGFMDKVLLVVEAEVSNREIVKRAYAELAATKADVSAVLNKSRSHGPRWLESAF
jgi:succinoglycan biosynthesis transport protein ExoP